ncbi:MAG: phosphoribosylamine--glycine ligase [Anaerolineae bacterium]
MRVLLTGSGGREHTLAWKLRQSPSVTELIIAPGNGGTAALGENVPLRAEDVLGLVDLARSRHVDFTVVGPEAPLALGIVDAFTEAGLRIAGPHRAAAELESSKAFSKAFMQRHGIPTAGYRSFEEFEPALAYTRSLPKPPVVKADGLAAGKGVVVADTYEEAEAALRQMLIAKEFGASSNTVVVEEHLEGQEVSLLAFTDGERIAPLIAAQDHKRIADGDTGPNTGGMGAYAPAAVLTDELRREAIERVIEPAVRGMAAEGRPYRGVLYAGLILTDSGIETLEFNCRFGDPEAQVLLPLLDCDLADVLLRCSEGRLDPAQVRWHEGACVCVVMASGGYPGHYATGHAITGIERAEDLGCLVFHAGTKAGDGGVVTSGGRVLGVTATGTDLGQAIDKAYTGVRAIGFEGAQYRSDIGAKGLALARAMEE